jgi:DNA excision repair protein ERCC-3
MEGEVFSLIGPKRFDVPWKEIESQGYIAPAECIEVRVNLSESERLLYATAEPEEKYRYCATTKTKSEVVQELVAYHANEQILVIGQYITQLDELSETLGVPLIKGDTPVKERERLFAAFRTGEITCLVVSKVANFSIDLPDATIAIQVSGAFGSRQEEAQRLGRILRPKSDGRSAKFYSVVSRDTVDQDFAANRQRFLAEQGYAYRIIDADDVFQGKI